jgi:hypothetical protein
LLQAGRQLQVSDPQKNIGSSKVALSDKKKIVNRRILDRHLQKNNFRQEISKGLPNKMV